MKKSDLLASNSFFAYGSQGLNHRRVTEERDHMRELVAQAEANPNALKDYKYLEIETNG